MRNQPNLRNSKFSRSRGYVLIILLMIIPVIFLIAATVHQRYIHDLRFTRRDVGMKEAFYIAQAGERAAMYEFGATNYQKFTHAAGGGQLTGYLRTPVTLPNNSIDAEGWTVWEWNPGDTHKSFSDSGYPEKFRYRIIQMGPELWAVESQGYFSDYKRTIVVNGITEGAFRFALFANESLSEFVRGPNQTITGRVHSNGNIYFRPSGSRLDMYSPSVTAAGDMIRYEDAWGRPDRGGTVRIQNDSNRMITMEGYSQGRSGRGNAYDTFNPNWRDNSSGAISRWNGRVLDGSLGAGNVEPPNLQSFEDGGYYNQQAGMIIDSTSFGSGISDVSFYNNAEGRLERVKQIDVSTFAYPSNGLVYAKTPVRLVNAEKLPGPLTVVSNSTIYTRGDVNMHYPDKTSYDNNINNKKPMALMTSARIYHLSGSYSDKTSSGGSIPRAKDPSRFKGDPNNQIEVNAALVDGAPQVDEINYVPEWNGVSNPIYSGVDNPGRYTWANSDDFLENMAGVTMKKSGSVVHLENANMASLDNSDAGPGVTAWVYRTFYKPPIRDYSYDDDLGDSKLQPPFFPVTARKLGWKVTQ